MKKQTLKPNYMAVTEANRYVYDTIYKHYNQIDPRRSNKEEQIWLKEKLFQIASELHISQGDKDLSFLDAGAGTGFLSDYAKHYFNKIFMVDVSEKILPETTPEAITRIMADCSRIPLPENSIDCVGAFAFLHHIFDHEPVFKEFFRLLKPGGIFFSDHDIDASFIKTFKLPLIIYRKAFGHDKKLFKLCPELSKEQYSISEFHGDKGLQSAALKKMLSDIGFQDIEINFHWDGMGLLEKFAKNKIIKYFFYRQHMAPILRIKARK